MTTSPSKMTIDGVSIDNVMRLAMRQITAGPATKTEKAIADNVRQFGEKMRGKGYRPATVVPAMTRRALALAHEISLQPRSNDAVPA